MAEVFGIIAGAVSLAEIAVKASDKLLTLIHETKHAPEEIVALEDEMHCFRNSASYAAGRAGAGYAEVANSRSDIWVWNTTKSQYLNIGIKCDSDMTSIDP